jgi:hypothetical protein
LFGGRGVPFRQAVATKAREVHEVDILHITALLQMGYQRSKCRCFGLGLLIFCHGLLLTYNGMLF